MLRITVIFLALLLVLLRFRVDHGVSGCVDMDLHDIPVGAEDLDFSDGLAIFLFQFRFDHHPRHFLGRSLNGLIDRDRGVLDEVRDLIVCIVGPGDGAQCEQ